MAKPDLDEGWVKVSHELFAAIAFAGFSSVAALVLTRVITQWAFLPSRVAAVSSVEFARETGVDRSNVRRAIRELLDSGVITQTGENTYMFVKDYESWTFKGQPRLTPANVKYCMDAAPLGRKFHAMRRVKTDTAGRVKTDTNSVSKSTPPSVKSDTGDVSNLTPIGVKTDTCLVSELTPVSPPPLIGTRGIEEREERREREREEKDPLTPTGGGVEKSLAVIAPPATLPAPRFAITPEEADGVRHAADEAFDGCHSAAAVRACRDYPLAWVLEMIEAHRTPPGRSPKPSKRWTYYLAILNRYASQGASDCELARQAAEREPASSPRHGPKSFYEQAEAAKADKIRRQTEAFLSAPYLKG